MEGNDPPQLYHVADDPAEAHNLADAMPDRAAALARSFREWDAGMVRQVIPPDHPIYGLNSARARAAAGARAEAEGSAWRDRAMTDTAVRRLRWV